ncbi:hypothetical protein ACFWDA_21000 [Rhodococcus zopfii]
MTANGRRPDTASLERARMIVGFGTVQGFPLDRFPARLVMLVE